MDPQLVSFCQKIYPGIVGLQLFIVFYQIYLFIPKATKEIICFRRYQTIDNVGNGVR